MRRTDFKRMIGFSLVGVIASAGFWSMRHGEAADQAEPELLVVVDQAEATSSISFNRDIRPILSENCFACHGPDAAVADDAGGFRLDIREGAVVPAEASGKPPIVPGDADASEIIKRITTTKPNLVMPPPRAKISLDPEDVELLKRWINEGAKYEGHWAYETPTRTAAPQVNDANAEWARNDIDRFIAARLEEVGLSPSAEADKETLIRRVSLDLIGLPPTPDEIDAFVADHAPDAYEQLVDRLLASPQYGERIALIWLDAARYADTIGYQLDHYRNAWPYRDYVIESFNNNKPYDEFLVEQLAGDLLPQATDEQRLATAFNRMHMMNHEGGSIDEEFRVTAVADRIETIATVFMAQTYSCAMCHDHKYDPTTQQDYFNLFKYFHSIDERGVHSNRPERAAAYEPRMDWYPASLKKELDDAQKAVQQAQQKRLDQSLSFKAEQSAWEASLQKQHGVHWAKCELTAASSTQNNAAIEFKPDGSILLSGRDSPRHENITLTYRTQATGLRLIKVDALTDPWLNDRVGRAENGDAQPTSIQISANSLRDPTQTKRVKLRWAWATQSEQGNDLDALNLLQPGKPGWGTGTAKDKHPRTLMLIADEPFGFEGGTEIEALIEHQSGLSRRTLGRVRVDFAQAKASVIDAFPMVTRDWYLAGPFTGNDFDTVFDTAFGPEKTTAPLGPVIAADKQKWKHQPGYSPSNNHTLTKRLSAYYLARSILSPTDRSMRLRLGYINGLRVFLNGEEVYTFAASGNEVAQDKHASDLDLSLKAGENRLVLKIVNTKDAPTDFNWRIIEDPNTPKAIDPLALIPAAQRTAHGDADFSTQWETHRYGPNVDLIKANERLASVRRRAIPVSIMEERSEPKPMYLLSRGAYDKPIKDKPAKLELPSFIDLPLPEGEPNNRLGFAKWLARPDHPLTARVHVNRLWQMIFGKGIVSTAEDFGSQAAWPSHLALLDTLAVDFAESGWDQKALLKRIVMSATYRQQAKRNTQADEIDADNSLLSYFPRRRLPAELIRDNALAASGLLNETLGGPSVKPYQPPGLWREVSMGPRSNTNVFKRDNGENLYRRSIYTFIKRKSPPPQLATFGAPNRESCVVQRGVTNTPLQTLVLWNDEQMLEAARVLAQRGMAKAETDADRISIMVRHCTGSTPTVSETEILQSALEHYRLRYAAARADAESLLQQGEHPLPDTYDPAELASWMMVGSTILSLDETIVRD